MAGLPNINDVPYAREGQRTGALRFGDLRVMAPAGALCLFVHAVAGFTNQSLRRLRLHGLIERLPDTNTYILTPDGLRVALFYTKVHGRILRPLLAADRPPASLQLRDALRTLDLAVADYVTNARIGIAACKELVTLSRVPNPKKG